MALSSTEEALVRQLLDQQAAILSLAGNEATITSKLGATKVTLSDLDSASTVGDTDLFLVRQGTSDKSANGALVKAQLNSFLQAGDDAVQRSVQSKLRDVVSVFDFMTEAQIADVKARTYTLDVTSAVAAAMTCGARKVVFPDGGYRTNSGWPITAATTAREYYGDGFVTIKLFTSVQASCFEIQPGNQFLRFKNFRFDSNGNKNDGLYTYGILSMNLAYASFEEIRCTNFSGAGMEHRQCVYVGVKDYTAADCFYGLSWQLYAGVQCTAYKVDRAYISSCQRGITHTNSVDAIYDACVIEYCGSASINEGAFHMQGGSAVCTNMYFEANNRNIVSIDASATYNGSIEFAATAPDVVTYSAVAFNLRGWARLLPYQLEIARIKPDAITGRDLVIGENLTVPLAGGSVKYGNFTTETIKGQVASGVWTTLKTLTGQSGDGGSRVAYRYAVYAGRSDLTLGYDTGTILNGVARSDSGALPAWLRISGNDFQIQITSSSYGLDYGCTLLINNAIGAP